MSGWFFRILPFVLGTAVVAGITHIASIFLLPHVSVRNPAALLSGVFPINELEVVDPSLPQKVTLPFADPAMHVAVCNYDVGEKPVRLIIETGESFLSVVFLQPNGQIAHSVTDRAAVQRKLEIVVATPSQISALESQDPDDEVVQEWRLKVTETKGVIVIRALAAQPGDTTEVVAMLSRAECYQE